MSVVGETRVFRSGVWQRRGRIDVSPPLNDGFVLGMTKPDAINTGPRIDESSMTIVNGTVTLNTAGQIYENRVINGRIDIKAANITIRNCIIRMPVAVTSLRAISCTTTGATGVRIEFVRIEVPPANASYLEGYCIQGSGFTVHRCDLSGTIDGISLAGVNQRAAVAVEGCYIHGLTHYMNPPDTSHVDGSHNDCIQCEGNLSSVSIVGNYLRAGYTSSMLVTLDYGTYSVAPVITDNWFDVEDPGAGSILNIKYDTNKAEPRIFGLTAGVGVAAGALTIHRNRFTALYPAKARMILRNEQIAVTNISATSANRNIYEDGSSPVPVYNTTQQLTAYEGL